jgi:hypothetical protein
VGTQATLSQNDFLISGNRHCEIQQRGHLDLGLGGARQVYDIIDPLLKRLQDLKLLRRFVVRLQQACNKGNDSGDAKELKIVGEISHQFISVA